MSISSSSTSSADGLTLGALAVQLDDLAQRVLRLENGPQTPLPAEETMNQLRAMTERLFPGPIEASVEIDPEDPSRRWILFEVTTAGEYQDYRDLVLHWHDEAGRIILDSAVDCRLCVVPRR